MQKYLSVLLAASVSMASTTVIAGSPEHTDELKQYFVKKFPGVATESLKDGAYALDEGLMMQFKDIEEFPPWEDNMLKGEDLNVFVSRSIELIK